MSATLHDITTEEDIKVLVNNFYDKVNKDPLLSPVFNEHAHVNWEAHLPKMYDFWSNLLLNTNRYHGRPFPPHTTLPISAAHFDKWVKLFMKNVDEHFEGPTAEEAKKRAITIAGIFYHKLEGMKNN